MQNLFFFLQIKHFNPQGQAQQKHWKSQNIKQTNHVYANTASYIQNIDRKKFVFQPNIIVQKTNMA